MQGSLSSVLSRDRSSEDNIVHQPLKPDVESLPPSEMEEGRTRDQVEMFSENDLGVLLIVEDDAPARSSYAAGLEIPGRMVLTAGSAAEARKVIVSSSPSVVLLDIGLPDSSGLELLKEILREEPRRMVVMVTARTDEEAVVGAMRHGAMDYLSKPFSLHKLRSVVEKAFQKVRANQAALCLQELRTKVREDGFLAGRSPKMMEIFKLMGKLADSEMSVLITGETGTGKELVARALHCYGRRSGGPFVPVDVSAMPVSLIEAELFGFERGAFTGAVTAKPGKIESARGGTLFFDELGNIPLPVQVKLLRVLQEREVQRLGSSKGTPFDARFVSATSANLKELIAQGKFREDLYFRLAGMEMHLPALRERLDDLPFLIDHILARYTSGKGHIRVSEEALELMNAYSWPGNVRELEHVLLRAIALMRGSVIGPDELPERLRGARLLATGGATGVPTSGFLLPLAEMKHQHARRGLDLCKGNRGKAARMLGIDRKTLNALLDHASTKEV